MKKTTKQIEIAQSLIDNLQDYITLAKAQKKLKVENVDEKIETLTTYIISHINEI